MTENGHSEAGAIQRFLMDAPMGSGDERGSADFILALVNRLAAAGIRLSRASYALMTMHPEVLWRTVQWSAGDGVSVRDQPRARLDDPFYTKSAVAVVRQTRATIRVRLVPGDLPYPLCVDLRDQSHTDYVVAPLPFTSDQVSYVSFATAHPEASRLESLCKQLGTSLALSAAFAETVDEPDLIDLGEHALKGVKAPLRVFTRRAP